MPLSELEAPPEQPDAEPATDMGPRLPPDRLGRRLIWAVLISVLVNAVLWRVASQVVHDHLLAPRKPLTVRLVTLPPRMPKPRHKIVHKVVKPKPIVKPKSVIPPRPVVRHVTPPKPTPRPVVQPRPSPRPQPPAAHHRIVTAKGPTPARHTALAGGHATLGQPIAHQNVGEGHDNAQPPMPQPRPQPQVQPAPEPQPTPSPEPKPQPPPPPKPEPPPPAGPTQDAQPANQVNPDIPDELKTGDYKSHVRVKVDIHADGSFDATLVTSSGNPEVDRRVLDALKRWKWKPALQSGQPIASTQRFRFDFTVQ